MRSGEIAGLRWRSVDVPGRVVHVVEQARVRPAPGESPWGTLKTASSRRTVPVPRPVMRRLAAHRLAHPTADDEAVFRTATGRMWTSELVSAAMSTVGLRFHDMRHLYASHLIRHGRGPKSVQSMLGHASAMTTLDVYAHLWPDEGDLIRESAAMFVDDLLRDGGRAAWVSRQGKRHRVRVTRCR
ncbi:site-specific integrase [Corynebacterium bovis]